MKEIMRWGSAMMIGVSITACSAAAAPTEEATIAVRATDTDVPTETATATVEPTLSSTPTETATMTVTTPPEGDGVWTSEPPMLFARAAHAVVSTGEAIYALAGTGEGARPVIEVERFNGTEWMIETTLPEEGLNAPAAVILNERIYLIGGFGTTTNVPTDQMLVYNIAGKSWSKAAPLPAPRGGHAAVVSEGKIHVIGGGNSQRTLADHSMYDPATNTWTELAPLPRSEGSPAIVDVDGVIYAIGGRSGSSDYGFVYLYDREVDEWTEGPKIDPRGTAGAVLYCGAIYVFGGESQAHRRSLDDVLRLDPERQVWENLTAMPTPRNFARAVLFGDAVYVVGGSSTAGSSHASQGGNVVESFRVEDCGG